MRTVSTNTQIIYKQDYTCIVAPLNGKGGIFIGNLQAAQSLKTLKKHGIRAVLTAAKGIELTHPKQQIPFYLQVPAEDRQGFDLSRYFPQSISFIRCALETTSVMVHCLAGVSRSVCLVLAYLIKHYGLSYDNAYNLVKSRRSIVYPNEGFVIQLKRLEKQVRDSPSKSQSISGQAWEKSVGHSSPSRHNNRDPNPQPNHYHQRSLTPAYGSRFSPTKKPVKQGCYLGTHESPGKLNVNELPSNYQAKNKELLYETRNKSPCTMSSKSMAEALSNRLFNQNRRRAKETREKLLLFNNREGQEDRLNTRGVTPEWRRWLPGEEERGRSYRNAKPGPPMVESKVKNMLGNYDRLRHTSTAEAYQKLDYPISAIRERYSEYPKNELTKSRKLSVREAFYNDENSEKTENSLERRMKTHDYEGMRLARGDYAGMANNIWKPGAVVGLRKLKLLMEGY